MSKYYILISAIVTLGACGSDDPAQDSGGPINFASGVDEYIPGQSAGFGQENFPDVVLGPPDGRGPSQGSLDVLSLGVGGEITLAFEPMVIDGPGSDFIVFENAFWPGGEAEMVFAELAEVSVSEDGESWRTFPCDPTPDVPPWPGCAGWTPTLDFDPTGPLDPATAGGDAFDLADVGLTRARFIRIRDLETLEDSGSTSGFDLDAVGIIHY